MLRLTMLALGASLAVSAAAPNQAAAQLNGRERAEAAKRGEATKRTETRRPGVIVGTNDGRYECDDRNRRSRDRDFDRWCDDRENRRDRDRYDDRNKRKNKNGKGPKFCQNGEGHPVYGRDWCRQKGYDTGYGAFSRVDWGDVVLRRPRNVVQQRDLSRGTLQDILGSVILGRFDRQRANLRYSQPLTGRWVDSDAGYVLRLNSGHAPVAQVIDRNRDGRADVILLYNGR